MKFKLKEKFSDLMRTKDARNKLLIAAAALGVILILLSELNFSSPQAEESVQTGDYAEYVSTLNDELTNVISSIDGVGTCKVMITLKNTTGVSSGRVMEKNCFRFPAPSSIADSSRLSGTEAMPVRTIIRLKAFTQVGRMTAHLELYRSNVWVTTKYNGIMPPEKSIVKVISSIAVFAQIKSFLERAYAATTVINIPINVDAKT